MKTIAPTAQKLTPDEVLALLESPETFATYLCSLTPEQVEHYQAVFTKASMDDNVKKAILTILEMAQKESVLNQEQLRRELEPEIKRLQTCIRLLEQIQELERLASTL